MIRAIKKGEIRLKRDWPLISNMEKDMPILISIRAKFILGKYILKNCFSEQAHLPLPSLLGYSPSKWQSGPSEGTPLPQDTGKPWPPLRKSHCQTFCATLASSPAALRNQIVPSASQSLLCSTSRKLAFINFDNIQHLVTRHKLSACGTRCTRFKTTGCRRPPL